MLPVRAGSIAAGWDVHSALERGGAWGSPLPALAPPSSVLTDLRTGPAASSCASSKAGDRVWSGCEGLAASRHLKPPPWG